MANYRIDWQGSGWYWGLCCACPPLSPTMIMMTTTTGLISHWMACPSLPVRDTLSVVICPSLLRCNNNSLPGYIHPTLLFVFVCEYHSIIATGCAPPPSWSSPVPVADMACPGLDWLDEGEYLCRRLLFCEIGCTRVCLLSNIEAPGWTQHAFLHSGDCVGCPCCCFCCCCCCSVDTEGFHGGPGQRWVW